MTETDKAYLAALIDGEGTITLVRHHRGQFPQPRLAIANNSLELLRWVQERADCGHIICRTPRKDWHSQSFVWQAQLAGAVLRVLREVRPYLIVKRRQADLLLDRYKACTPRNGKYSSEMMETKGRLVEEIRRLNQRGSSRPSITRQAPLAVAGG